jgi:hypothetical protein
MVVWVELHPQEVSPPLLLPGTDPGAAGGSSLRLRVAWVEGTSVVRVFDAAGNTARLVGGSLLGPAGVQTLTKKNELDR